MTQIFLILLFKVSRIFDFLLLFDFLFKKKKKNYVSSIIHVCL